MNVDDTDRSRPMVRAGFLVAIAIVAVMASEILSAGQSPWENEAGSRTGRDARPLPEPKQTYVPGEVIVKFKDRPTNGTGLLSLPRVKGHEGNLLHLQAKYGLENKGPVFKRVYRRLENQGLIGGQVQSKLDAASVTRPTASALRARDLDLSRFYLLRTDRNVPALCAELRDEPVVEYAQPNYIYERCAKPNDPEFADQYAHQLIQMSDAWDISTGSHDIVVAVLDTGVDVDHPDLKDNIWVNADEIPDNSLDDDNNGYIDDVNGWNFGDENNDVKPEGGDWLGIANHGTQVSGVIAGVGNNGKGVCGVNWHSSIMVLRLSFDVTSAEVAAALDYAAANGAHVANMSFGSDSFGPEGDPAVKTAIDNAFAQGVLLVASAGNDDNDKPHYPAAYYNVMAVASTNGEDIKTGHSSFGNWVDITAPGTDIVTTDLNDVYIATAGTSFSAPYVAAVGALVLAHRPTLTHVEVRAILENTTDPVHYGDIDPNQGYVGTGRVNAYKALLAADRRLPLGEIIKPMPQQTFAPDVNDIPLVLFVHGDSYQLEYRGYEEKDWVLLDDGSSPVDPNCLVHLSFANPRVGVFELRLRVTADGSTHTDRKIFGMEFAPSQVPWPMPYIPNEPGEIPDEIFIGSPLCLDVDGDDRNEIVQSSIILTDFWAEGRINIWKEDGTSLGGWPKPMGETLWFPLIATGLAVGDIDGDGDYEVVAVDNWSVMANALHVENGQTVEGNWPVEVGGFWLFAYIIGSPILADLDGDGDSEIIVGLDEKSRESDGLFAIQGDGTFLWQRRYTTEGPMSAADFDGDGDVEIALSGYGPGITRVHTFILDHEGQQISRWLGGSKKGTVIADLDADGEPELVFCTEDSVQAVHIDGSTLWTTAVSGPFGDDGAISVGDIDGDGLSEVYVNSYIEADGFAFSLVHAFDHQGRELTEAGFPKTLMGDPSGCSPLVGDIDGDGQKELLVASAGAPIMAWESDGSAKLGFPMLGLSAFLYTCPTLEDLDQDGDLEMMVNGDDYQFHVIDLPGSYDPTTLDWGMSRHDSQNSGWALPAPKLDPILLPEQIQPGQKLKVQLTTSHPVNLPPRLLVNKLPEGAFYDAESSTVSWEPTIEQVFQSYTFAFTVTDGIRQDSRTATVEVLSNAIYYAGMDTNPDWTLDTGWDWGTPVYMGVGKNNDPVGSHTGENVIGYALWGDYRNNIAETRYATTRAINCKGFKNIHLSFWRWLGIESPGDYACVQVSNDRVTWTDLWTAGQSAVLDNAWQFVDYAVPADIADDLMEVYFRWGIGPTDNSVTNAGWNIDDVQVTGDSIN